MHPETLNDTARLSGLSRGKGLTQAEIAKRGAAYHRNPPVFTVELLADEFLNQASNNGQGYFVRYRIKMEPGFTMLDEAMTHMSMTLWPVKELNNIQRPDYTSVDNVDGYDIDFGAALRKMGGRDTGYQLARFANRPDGQLPTQILLSYRIANGISCRP